MSVASHLGIRTDEYDRQILTLIPHYDEMLDAAAAALAALDRPGRTLVDLGIGSGALAQRCLRRLKGSRVVGIDADPQMLALARRRLGRRLTAVVGAIETAPLPPCDVVTASFALHHIPSPATKARVFARAFAALRPGGVLVEADCLTAESRRLRRRDHAAWHAHLAESYGRAGATRFLKAWAGEDTYFPLDQELTLMAEAGFDLDVAWRKDSFAVVVAAKPKAVRRRRRDR